MRKVSVLVPLMLVEDLVDVVTQFSPRGRKLPESSTCPLTVSRFTPAERMLTTLLSRLTI